METAFQVIFESTYLSTRWHEKYVNFLTEASVPPQEWYRPSWIRLLDPTYSEKERSCERKFPANEPATMKEA